DAFSSVFLNLNNRIGNDELATLYRAGSRRWDYNVQRNAVIFKDGSEVRNTVIPNIFDYRTQVYDYCNWLVSSGDNVGPRSLNQDQVRKIEQICDNFGIENKGSVDLRLD
ncbi:16211_t:CDS:1, partial [Acaulospora colombiana]